MVLRISDTRSMRHCQGWTRRDFLQIGAAGSMGALLGSGAASSLLAAEAIRGDSSSASPPPFARDKSVVLLFLQGGPPQIETFDPKMEAPENVRSCTGECPTKIPGVSFGGNFPQLAARADRLAIVRSFGSGDGGHNQLPVLTGNSRNGATMGAHYSRLVGANHPRTALPTHTVLLPEQIDPELKLGQPTGPFTYDYIKKNYVVAGSLGQAYEAMLLNGGRQLTENLELRLSRGEFDDRRLLLSQIDQLRRKIDGVEQFAGVSATQSRAYDVLLRGIADAFDFAKEDPRTIARYDTRKLFRMEDWHKGGKNFRNLVNQSRITNLLGHQMLLARRLCEAGCGFVTVVDGCWDFHGDGNNPPVPVGMPLLGPQVDHAVAAFLDDLRDRGLSEKVLLVITGEMGRSPQKGKNGGTGHWGQLTPLLLAGGGLKMGQIIGETDRNGGEPISHPYRPEHLLATIMQTMFDPSEARLSTGIPADLARLITAADPIRELFA